eukprot:TRINITY_DN3308_c0_g1_i2.p1 TRINITY_DN3308_c0_g1~~TRINITY_DN3308_c0_g1_i2.p1  ORF type:complete len:375 (+),score=87.02 TRINITY_DN3308_c0_g1_i2:224-1348(+)
MAFFKGGGFCKGGGKGAPSDDCDWICTMCRERNFAKRPECFKCRMLRTPDAETIAQPRASAPPNGTTLQGIVKSYNKKGFGFIMVLGMADCQDVHYTRENVCNKLFNPDMPGEHVTFEIHRAGDGRLTGRNIRRAGTDRSGMALGGSGVRPGAIARDGDQSQDWICSSCRERNFARRWECIRCKQPKPGNDRASSPSRGSRPTPAPPRRSTFSPHAGARAIRESLASEAAKRGAGGGGGGGGARRSSSSKSRGRSRSSSRGRKKKKSKKRRKSSTSSSSSSSDVAKVDSDDDAAEAGAGGLPAASANEDPEIAKAKAEALQQLVKLKEVEPKEARMTEWRALLRRWHPDKNPNRTEVATAVFQFLQKGKMLMDA